MTEDGPKDGSELPARRLHPASPFISLVFVLRQLVLPLGATVLIGRDSGFDGSLQVALGLPVVIALLQLLSWLRFRYRVEGGALIVDSGVLNRRHREIPLDRIHHVEEVAKLQHRLFGVVNLKIDSGGGESGAEIELDALSKRSAAQLRSFIDGSPESPGPIIRSAASESPPLVRAGVGALVVAGITNVPFLATVGVFGSALQLVDELGDDWLINAVEMVPPTLVGLAGVFGLFAILYVVAAASASVLTNFGFVLERRGSELRTQKGLLDRRRAVVDLAKLTVIRLDETIVRRALGLCSLRLQTISGGGSGVGSLSIPIVAQTEVERIVGELMPVASPLPALMAHPPAARRRLYLRRVVLTAAVAFPVAWFWRPVGVFIAALLLVLAACRAEVSYRALGHATTDGVLVSRAGGLRRETAVTTWERAESTRLRSSPLQRWAGLATLYVDVPQGRSVAVSDADPSELNELRKRALTGPARP